MQKTFGLRPKEEKEAVPGKRDLVLQAEETAHAKAPSQGEAWRGLGQATGQRGWGTVSRGEQTMQSETTGTTGALGVYGGGARFYAVCLLSHLIPQHPYKGNGIFSPFYR